MDGTATSIKSKIYTSARGIRLPSTNYWRENLEAYNLNLAIQKALKDVKLYTGKIDGRFGPKTYAALEKWIRNNKVDPSKWSNKRLRVAGEQLLYKLNKINPGLIDGLEGPDLRYAREIWDAKLVTTWRDKADEIATVAEPVKTTIIKPSGIIKPFHNWPLQKDVRKFFGAPGSNQVQLELPFPMVVAWDTKQVVHRFSCHKLVEPAFKRWLQRTLDYYGYEKIKELRIHYYGGCLNVRKMRGSKSWSMHSWGIGLDLDPDRNAFKTPWKKAQFSKPEYKKFIEFAYDEGLINLGIEANRDGMHFQAARLK